MAARTMFVFGMGYSARALARRLLAEGWSVRATTRSLGKADELAREGIAPFLFDGTAPVADIASALDGVTHILSSVPPDADGDPVLRHHADALAACAGAVDWAGYLSTTGVYGDRGGDWVDEGSERRPATERGARRVAAEDAWCALWRGHGLPVHLFRLAGIYGPGRNALETVRAGNARRIVKPGQVFSRIHVDDIAAVLSASIAKPNPGAAYNVCDDDPAPPQEVIAFACELLGVEAPPEIAFADAAPGMSAMARSFYAESKRVSNRRIKHELGVRLAWPDYRAGLRAAIVQST